jgi:hypothetical protein
MGPGILTCEEIKLAYGIGKKGKLKNRESERSCRVQNLSIQFKRSLCVSPTGLSTALQNLLLRNIMRSRHIKNPIT